MEAALIRVVCPVLSKSLLFYAELKLVTGRGASSE